MSENPPSGPESVAPATSSDRPEGKASQNLEQLLDQVESPQPIRLPTKSKSKPIESDSDSDSKSTKSSASSSCSKVARSFKKTFKGKAIAIVKPFSNPAPEKKSLDSKPVHESVESSTSSEVREGKFAESRMFFELWQVTDEYDFGAEEEEEEAERALEESSSRRKEGVKPVRHQHHHLQQCQYHQNHHMMTKEDHHIT